jgi:CrcB protein
VRILLVLIGGGLGSVARYLTSTWMANRFGAAFPWGTLTVNVAGAFVIGLIATLADDYGRIGPQARLLLVVGVLGGFTTFSSFSLETFRLGQDGELLSTVLNLAGNVVLSLIAVTLGVAAARGLER